MIDYGKFRDQLGKNPDPVGRAKAIVQKILSEVEQIAKDAPQSIKDALEELTKGCDAELGSLVEPPAPGAARDTYKADPAQRPPMFSPKPTPKK